MIKDELKPFLIEGGMNYDDRGNISFFNDFQFKGIKRFYIVANNQSNFVRAWHAHRKEAKYVIVIQGAAVIAAVKIDNWEKPSKTAEVYRHVISAQKPAILYIPPGYANGFMSLTIDTKLIFYSTSSLKESSEDDIRYDSRYWDAWKIVER
jgi:dTDP-4-dehydrorhamnose 3,5-epimerase